MRVVSWIVNGIKSCIQQGFDLVFTELNADVFCIQESRIQAWEVEQYNRVGYYLRSNCSIKTGY